MIKKNNSDYSKAISLRIKTILALSGLEIAGFAEFTNISESHLYAIINGTRNLTRYSANKIAQRFNIKVSQLLNPKFEITSEIGNSKFLTKFYEEYKLVPGFFQKTRNDRKKSHYIETELLKNHFFYTPASVADVKAACDDAGKKYNSKQISQILNYLVSTKKLEKRKIPVKLKSAKSGKRVISIFSQLPKK